MAADQNLLVNGPDLKERRNAFRDELRGIVADMDKVDEIAREQFYFREQQRRAQQAP